MDFLRQAVEVVQVAALEQRPPRRPVANERNVQNLAGAATVFPSRRQAVIQVVVAPIVACHRVIHIEIIHIDAVFTLRSFEQKYVHSAQADIHLASTESFPVARQKIQRLFIARIQNDGISRANDVAR